MSISTNGELRFQGVDFVRANLSKLDLRNINFKYAIMHHYSLADANLSGCCFEHVDLSHANLRNPQFICVKMSCANLAAANLHSCNFEDSGGLQTMEGVNLKDVNLEGSYMAAVNL